MKAVFNKWRDKALSWWNYCSAGVWTDTRRNLKVSVVKTVNLSVRSFFNSDIQSLACAMTYRVLLAIVPALALLLAIGRGFGFQKILQDELYSYFPAQHVFIEQCMGFVDSYLNQASEGIFVGVGLLFLLWTLISLISNVEESFDMIWGVKQGRSIWRKISDYTAVLLILPVLMICSSGLSVLISNTLNSIFHFSFMTPVITWILEGASWLFIWLFFTAAYLLIPNTKVKFANAFIAGVFAGTGFMILQWLFVSGQMYVSKYNAIYGSFSFLPLLLIWLQLVWVITLAGMIICYSSQNILQYSFNNEIAEIAPSYFEKVALAVATVTVQRFAREQPPVTQHEFTVTYNLPARLITDILQKLETVGIVSRVVIDETKQIFGYQPALPITNITVALVRERMRRLGRSDFVPDFEKNFPGVIEDFKSIQKVFASCGDKMLLTDIEVAHFDISPNE